jgi:hypothetical protein
VVGVVVDHRRSCAIWIVVEVFGSAGKEVVGRFLECIQCWTIVVVRHACLVVGLM